MSKEEVELRFSEMPGGKLGGIHALFHGSDLGCAYGGMTCPTRMRLQRLLDADTRASESSGLPSGTPRGHSDTDFLLGVIESAERRAKLPETPDWLVEIEQRRALVADWPDVSGGEGSGRTGYLRIEEALYRDAIERGDDSFWMGRTRPSALFIANAPTDIDRLITAYREAPLEIARLNNFELSNEATNEELDADNDRRRDAQGQY